MTRREFYAALKVLEREGDPGARQTADAEFARQTADAWTQQALAEAAALATISRRWEIAQVLVWSLCFGVVLQSALEGWFDNSFVLLFPCYVVSLAARRAGSHRLIPLLARLDDRRLTPLWLEALPRATDTLHRVAIRRRLTRHLPDWHLGGEPLPPSAQRALYALVRRLVRQTRSAEENDLLIAALVSLDAADGKTQRAVTGLVGQASDERVALAAEDAVQRLGAGRSTT